MTKPIPINPPDWKPAKGYANGVLAPDGTLQIAGQIGWQGDQIFRAHDFIGQLEQVLRNILAVVEAAGGEAADITRLTWFVKDKAEYAAKQAEVGATYRKVLGRHFPAMTLVVVADLLEPAALLEIEATAHIAPKA